MFNCDWIPVGRGADKICHFLVGAFIVIIGTLVSGNDIVGLIAMAVAGVGKELFDYLSYGKFGFFDMFATLAGGVIGIMGLHLVQLLIY